MDTDETSMSTEERVRLLDQLPPSTPLTLERAAQLAGYRSVSALRQAARDGRLRVTRHSPRSVVTTAGDLREFLSRLQQRGHARGQPRKGQDAAGDTVGE